MQCVGSWSGNGPSQRAYTLAEVTVATLLLSTLLIALYAGMSGGLAYTAMIREELRATQVMLERLEGIRLYNWDQIHSNGFVPPPSLRTIIPTPPIRPPARVCFTLAALRSGPCNGVLSLRTWTTCER